MTATIPAPLTEHLSDARCEFLATMFTTAIEGGISYWCVVTTYHWMDESKTANSRGILPMDLRGFKATIRPGDNGEWGFFEYDKDRQPLTIDLAVMERGVRLFRRYCHGELDSHGKPVPEELQKPMRDDHYWRAFLMAEASHGQHGDYDAEVADQVVQWGLFGVGVYG